MSQPRLHVGDTWGRDYVVTGFASKPSPAGHAGQHGGNDYALIKKPGMPEAPTLLDVVLGGTWEPTGPDPLAGAAKFELSQEWRRRLDHVLFGPGQPWASYVTAVCAAAREAGHLLLLGGGAVRRTLRSAPLGRCDLDFAGTALARPWRQLLIRCEEGLADCPRSEMAERRKVRLNTSPDVRFVTARSSMYELALDYAPLVEGRRTTDISSDGASWVYGTSVVRDARWRDLSCNTVLYLPDDGCLVDPLGHGLSDLGVQPESLAKDASHALRAMAIRPIVVAEGKASPEHLLRQITRVVKFIADNGPDNVDILPLTAWADEHRADLAEAVAWGTARRGRRSKPTKLTKLFAGQELDRERLGKGQPNLLKRSFGKLLWQDIHASLPRRARVRGPGGGGVVLCGGAVSELRLESGSWVLGEVDGPEGAGSPAAYFGRQFDGYEHARATVLVDDAEVEGVLVLRPAKGDGPYYAERLEGQLVQVTRDQLRDIRQRDEAVGSW